MNTSQHFKIFLASPSDVQAERNVVREVLQELNAVTARSKNIHFDIIGWEIDAYPGFGGDGQHIINREMGNMTEYDLLIGIMWNKFGSATQRAGSGTEEEFQRAFDVFQKMGKPDIAFYFKNEPANLSSEVELTQKMKVIQFKQSLFPHGLISDFTDTNDFRTRFRRDMERRLATLDVAVPNPPQNPIPSPSSVRPISSPPVSIQPIVNDSGMWVFLNGRYFLAESVQDTEENNMAIKTLSRGAEDDAFFKSLRGDKYHRGEPVPFAHQNDGGLVRVLTAASIATASGKVWSIEVQPEETSHGGFTEIGVNRISSEQIVEMRARLLLLNELPIGRYGKPISEDINDLMLLSSIRGIGGKTKVEGGVFPELWAHFRDRKSEFLPLARLWAIFHLKTSGTVEHILELTLGPRQGNSLHVCFRGQRHRVYSNVPPPVIEVEGDCDLTAKPTI